MLWCPDKRDSYRLIKNKRSFNNAESICQFTIGIVYMGKNMEKTRKISNQYDCTVLGLGGVR